MGDPTVPEHRAPLLWGAKQVFVCYNSKQMRDNSAFGRGMVMRLEHLEQLCNGTNLPAHTTLDGAVELYLANVCSLGRAAELAGATRWDILDALHARGAMQRPVDFRSTDEING